MQLEDDITATSDKRIVDVGTFVIAELQTARLVQPADRAFNAPTLRADADTLSDANVIFGGDFSGQKAGDLSAGIGAYRTFNAADPGQVFDSVNQVGDWHGNAVYKGLDTEDTANNMDDRFDMQLWRRSRGSRRCRTFWKWSAAPPAWGARR